MKPREMKKATTISQIVLFPKPLRAWLMVSVSSKGRRGDSE
jgi:hypothetical protein